MRSGVSSVSETNVIVAGASGYAGALAAELVDRHPSLALRFATSRNHAGTRLRDLYPRYRSQVELTELDLGELEDVEAAIVAYPHGAAAPVVAGMRGLGLTVVDLSADFRLVDAAGVRALVRAARRARAARERGLRAHGAESRRDSRRRPRRQPGLLSDRGDPRARPARRARADLVGGHRREVRRLRRRARRRRAALVREPDRVARPVRARRPPPSAGDRAGAVSARLRELRRSR